MQVIPSIDVQAGRSRVVFWPGVASGVGAPTDQPHRIAEHFVELGAPLIHIVDFDGARRGEPVNLDALGAIAAAVATPIQVAGGLEGADRIRLAFAAGATRAVLATSVVDDHALVRDCLAVAGDWLAVGLDPRPERLEAFPWRRARTPTVRELTDELAGLGVRRFVLAHGGSAAELDVLAALARDVEADLLVAGGVTDLDGLRRLRDVGVTGIILGEALLSGALDYAAAVEIAS
ncbi:MAG: HisA/HisF-related TIM barrel protein [Chloroflexi bacterium]|nr:HisA/HisF-related TIM barrel protein [Chloroflexota bacterium]